MAPETADLSVRLSSKEEEKGHVGYRKDQEGKKEKGCPEATSRFWGQGKAWLSRIPRKMSARMLWVLWEKGWTPFRDRNHLPRLYQTSISPLRVLTSMIVCPKKSSDSFLKCCFTRDLISSSSSQTLTFIRSVELWHSLQRKGRESSGAGQEASPSPPPWESGPHFFAFVKESPWTASTMVNPG